jgi:hypothetical protein
MKRTYLIIISIFFVFNRVSDLTADEIRIINKTEDPLNIWYRKPDENAWLHPPLLIKQKNYSLFNFEGEGLYYIVTKTLSSEEDEQILGLIDFRKMKTRSATAALIIDSNVVGKGTKEVPYTICKAVPETRTRERIVMRQKIIGGRCVLIPEVISEKYIVDNYVQEQAVKTFVYDIIKLSASAQDNDGPLTSRVTLKTQNEGAFIRYRLAARKEELISDNPTQSTQDIPIGIYIMWSQRNEKATSQKIRYDIYEKEKTITIPEKPLSQ